jgi:hypothetical protein
MFKVAGISRLNGEVKVRFANDMTRVKVLNKKGHTEVELMELPQAMDKGQVVAFLKTSKLYLNAEYKEVIDAADAKYNTAETVKVTTKPKASKTKSTVTNSDIVEAA